MTARFGSAALRQIADIIATIEKDDPGAAAKFALRIETVTGLLARHPML